MLEQDIKFMQLALVEAQKAWQDGEVPVGAILVKDSEVVAQGFNRPIKHNDPTAHAEIVALRSGATKFENYRLLDTTLYVTLEPCAMCLGAMLQARIKRLVFGAFDLKAGAVQSVFHILDAKELNHHIEYSGGVLATECREILQEFFRHKRS